MCHGFSCWCCHVPWSIANGETWDFLADFSRWWQGIRQRRITRALLCTFMLWVNGKGVFLSVKNYLISRCEWVISARARCMFVLYREFMKENSVNLWVSYYFCSFCEFAKVFEREVWRVRVAHLHRAKRALLSPGPVFLIVNKSWQRSVSLSVVLRCCNSFHQRQKATTIMCVSFTKWNFKLRKWNTLDKEFWYPVNKIIIFALLYHWKRHRNRPSYRCMTLRNANSAWSRTSLLKNAQ